MVDLFFFFFFSSRRRHTRSTRDWSSDVCSSDLPQPVARARLRLLKNGDGGPAGDFAAAEEAWLWGGGLSARNSAYDQRKACRIHQCASCCSRSIGQGKQGSCCCKASVARLSQGSSRQPPSFASKTG